jgi:glucose/arabinose dehydrogenase
LIMLALLVAACGDDDRALSPVATPTLVAQIVLPTATPAPLIDRELLGAADLTAACDAPPEATFTCTDAAVRPQIEMELAASTFGRWSLHGLGTQPLSGDETLTLQVARTGNVAPNLYLVSADGARMGVALSRFGLGHGAQTLHVPLREVRDENGQTPDFAQVSGLEIVFEWADMQGTFAIESVRLDSVWREPVAVQDDAAAMAAALTLPPGFTATAIADNLRENTQIEFTPDGDMLVSLQNGRIWWYERAAPPSWGRQDDAPLRFATRRLYATGFSEVVGLLYDPSDGGVWVGGRGQLVHTLDSDGNGVADTRTARFSGLPWGRHQNNGLTWNPDPDPFTGEPGGSWIYFGYGSTDDLSVGGDLLASVLRFPRDGQSADDLEVVSQGNRNAYDVVFTQLPIDLADPTGPTAWQLFASENGPDFNDAPDEVNHIRWGHHFGFPNQFGPVGADGDTQAVEGDPYSGPIYPVTPHASANGLAYIDHPDWPAEYRTLYVALFGEVFNPKPVGHIVERIALRSETTPQGEPTYRGEPSPFVVGLDRPLPLATAPNGNLLVGDYATGVLYEIGYVGE